MRTTCLLRSCLSLCAINLFFVLGSLFSCQLFLRGETDSALSSEDGLAPRPAFSKVFKGTYRSNASKNSIFCFMKLYGSCRYQNLGPGTTLRGKTIFGSLEAHVRTLTLTTTMAGIERCGRLARAGCDGFVCVRAHGLTTSDL